MTSKDRVLSRVDGKKVDHIPLTTWCFGFKPRKDLMWHKDGKPVNYWYSLRMEHIHTLPYKWELEDDFKRVLAWNSIGLDDLIDISIPWSTHPDVKFEDSSYFPKDSKYPVMSRKYYTPAGTLEYSVKKTGEKIEDGWVIQPDYVPLFEDYNIPRGVHYIVTKKEDIEGIQYLYASPDRNVFQWTDKRLSHITDFVTKYNVPVQSWSAFGMDAVVWLMGIENAVFLAVDDPESFRKLTNIIFNTDYARTELACKYDAIDIIVQRGWYSSTDFWSPNIFKNFVIPYVKELANLSHKNGKKFAYTMTTGLSVLGKELIKAGVDIIYFIDPYQDNITLEDALKIFDSEVSLVGGINSIMLNKKDKNTIKESVKKAIKILDKTNRFILHPVDALFPDTPWEGLEIVINEWKSMF